MITQPEVSEAAVHNALLGVIDPELGDNIVELGMVRSVEVSDDGAVAVEVALTTEGCPLRTQLRDDVRTRVSMVPGVSNVKVTFGVMDQEQKASLMHRARFKAQEGAPVTDIPPTARVVAIASGKGGVGKSSVTANLAAALAARGLVIGVLDADIWGFSIPRMFGVDAKLEAEGTTEKWHITPVEVPIGDGQLRLVSMGFLAQEQEAIMWRGLILNRALQHFIEDVAWSEPEDGARPLDYLLVDLPPGTGDIQMGLARMLPRAEMVIVTTPALAAQKVASRAADMARKGHLRVAGVIENMSSFTCDHGTEYALFGSGGGDRLARELGVPLLARIPLEPAVASGADAGKPAALDPTSQAASVFADLAERVVTEAVPLVKMADCTAMDLLAKL